MGSKQVVEMFLKTLGLGAVAGLLTSFIVEANRYSHMVSLWDGFGLVIFFIGLGMAFSAVSQTGFFAYLYINRFGSGFFRTFWPTVQLFVIAVVLFDLIYLQYRSGSDHSLLNYILVAAAILVYGLIIAAIKAKETEKHAFIPALFLMVVMTILEWVPVLWTSGEGSRDYRWLMIIPLLACNTYQLLMLHRLNRKGRLEAQQRQLKQTGNQKQGKRQSKKS